jgi:hypothetical protein
LNTNLTDPFGTLLDRDWLAFSGSEVEFSHTDSHLTGRIVLADISARIAIAGWRRPGNVMLDFIVGYRHQSFDFDGWGITGWQWGVGSVNVPVFLDASTKVIHYDSQNLLPHIGLGLRARVSPRIVIDADAAFAVVISIEHDDHVLRFKQIDATTTGVGVILRLAPQWIVYGASSGRASVALGLDAQLCASIAWGTVHQHYYADDPYLPGDQRLVPIPDSAATTPTVAGTLRTTLTFRF